MRRCSLKFFYVVFLASLSGCSPSGPKFVRPDYQPNARVVVLPFENETNDVSAPETVRKFFIKMLPQRGYDPLPQDLVDSILLEKFGITEGGQLRSVTPQELGEGFGVDVLFYGNVLTFVDLPLGFTRKRSVKSEIQMVDAKSGEKVWEDEKGWIKPEFALTVQDAKEALARQIAQRQLEKMTGTFLNEETKLMLERILANLPIPKK